MRSCGRLAVAAALAICGCGGGDGPRDDDAGTDGGDLDGGGRDVAHVDADELDNDGGLDAATGDSAPHDADEPDTWRDAEHSDGSVGDATGPDADADDGDFADAGNVDAGSLDADAVDAGDVGAGPLVLRTPPRLVSAENHNCLLSDTGTLECWGDNRRGELGVGNNAPSGTRQQVGEPDSWLAVGASEWRTCAVSLGGALYCWGGGELTPTRVGIDSDWHSVALSRSHTCGLRNDGSIWCWGSNSRGSLGTGDEVNHSEPTQVDAAVEFVHLRTFEDSSCAVARNGSLWCWGNNFFGQLGLEGWSILSPTLVQTGSWEDVAITTFAGHALATDGTLVLFRSRTDMPEIEGDTPWTGLGGGSLHRCAIGAAGALWCWGRNTRGQLGDGNRGYEGVDVSTPIEVLGGHTFAQVAGGARHTCGLTTDDRVYCWGDNSFGQLGLGHTGTKARPSQVGTATDWTAVAAGVDLSCGVRASTGLSCWGRHRIAEHPGDLDQEPIVADAENSWLSIAAGQRHVQAVAGDGSLHGWGWNRSSQVGISGDSLVYGPVTVGTETDWSAVSAGSDHSCGRRGTALYCWGSNAEGQLGSTASGMPRLVSGTWAFVDAFWERTCALADVGSLWCWGNSGVAVGAPEQVETAEDWIDVGVGAEHTCGVRSPGALWCWGRNGDGRLGTGGTTGTSDPAPVGAETDWTVVGAGYAFSCGLRAGGALYCWGGADFGQTGVDAWQDTLSPALSDDGHSFAQLSVGGAHSCAIDTEGALFCWGDNADGQLGDGSAWRFAPQPVAGF